MEESTFIVKEENELVKQKYLQALTSGRWTQKGAESAFALNLSTDSSDQSSQSVIESG